MPELAKTSEQVYRGIPVSEGICRGKIVVVSRPPETEVPKYAIAEADLPEHTNRLEQALVQTRHQIQEVQRKVVAAMGAADASIFDAHLLMLDDPVLLDEALRLMQQERVNVEYAFSVARGKYLATLEAVDDEYLRERTADVRDVTARVLHNLLGGAGPPPLPPLQEPCILVAHDLAPSQTAVLDKKLVLGFAIDQGTKTCHTAILARAHQLPAVTGLQEASQRLKSGQYALLDGFGGALIVDPTDQTLFEYGQLARKHAAVQERLQEVRDQRAITLDGVAITLSANVESPDETAAVQANGAEGIGLFRTEYLFLNRESLPTEEEQFQAYYQVAAALQPQPVVIRTLDLGGDKVLRGRHAQAEHNPFLGWRAIRMCLQERDLFRRQLRAVLRAAVLGNIKLMYPMISGLDELLQANGMVEECKAELRRDAIPFAENLEVGAMIEIPSAAVTADALAKRVRFFSLGTNDLIQYSLGVDRMNPKIAHLYEPTHPAIVRLIKTTVDAAHAHGIWVGVCGEMAGDPVLVPLLLGLGVDELSAAPGLVPAVKFLIRQLKMSEAEALAEFALKCENGAETLSRAQALANAIAPSLFEGAQA
jgi:phosphotransferase system enzyme I (PtsI)